jgi:hypothetical protein
MEIVCDNHLDNENIHLVVPAKKPDGPLRFPRFPGVDVMITNFGDFSLFSAKVGGFLESQCYDNYIGSKLLLFESKSQLFAKYFESENISEIITLVPGRRHLASASIFLFENFSLLENDFEVEVAADADERHVRGQVDGQPREQYRLRQRRHLDVRPAGQVSHRHVDRPGGNFRNMYVTAVIFG